MCLQFARHYLPNHSPTVIQFVTEAMRAVHPEGDIEPDHELFTELSSMLAALRRTQHELVFTIHHDHVEVLAAGGGQLFYRILDPVAAPADMYCNDIP